ncbi:hypothetical protein ACJ73_09263 [Blastomyces percursus]|uniref:Uncharacterized protein n=1 Tax=Blastomyces percursus TaxID=1658174 RepID=A0A1J9PYN6_9EURO|nr:hypothetical protein ACJ73_09263 [Blastomyces percursus]
MQFFHKNKSQESLVGSVDNWSNHPQHQQQQQHYHQNQPHHQPQQALPQAAGESLDYNSDAQYQHYSYADNQTYDQDYAHPHPAHAVQYPYSYQNQQPTDPNLIPGLAITSFSPVSPQPAPNYSRRPTLNPVPPAASGFNSSDTSANREAGSSELSGTLHSPQTSPPLESLPKKSRRSIFGFSSSKDATTPSPKVLGRNLSVRKKDTAVTVPPSKTLGGKSIGPTPECTEEQAVESHMPLSKKAPQSHHHRQRPSYPSRNANRSSSHLEAQTYDQRPENRSIQRVNTDPLSSQESLYTHRESSDSFQAKQLSEVQQPAPRNPQFQINYPTRRDSVAHFTEPTSDPPPYSSQPEILLTARPPSQQSGGPPPSPLNQYQSADQTQQKPAFRQTLQPFPGPTQVQGSMPPERQTGLRQQVDSAPQHGGQGREGMAGGQPQYPPNLAQGGSFKGNLSQQSLGDHDRQTPPPANNSNNNSNSSNKGREDLSEAEVRALVQKHEELQAKYLKVKKYYFEKDAQVQLLQNTVAHQRMATSRTVLDDSEYLTRFSRLDGAINNLAFNIRKEWRSIPVWLQGFVNDDAIAVGTKEMTAVGRACLSRWLVDEIFDRYFHPGLEPNLSRNLKMIERNVRCGAKIASEEDRENHLSKLSAWRRTTLDGLGDVLQSRAEEENRSQLIKGLVEKFTAALEMHLKVPPPPGLENGVSMIVELAVGISSNVPFESREISIEYFLPGSPISDTYMKLETSLPPLVSSSEPQSAVDQGPATKSMKPGLPAEGSSMLELDRESGKDSSSASATHSSQAPVSSAQPKESRKKSVFGSLISKKPHSGGPGGATQGQAEQQARPASALMREREREEAEFREGDSGAPNASNNQINRIRFAAFVAVEVRSKGAGNVIVHAPVYGVM